MIPLPRRESLRPTRERSSSTSGRSRERLTNAQRCIPFFLRSMSEEKPMSSEKIFGTFGNTWDVTLTNFFIVFWAPIDVVVHGHEDDAILEIFGQNIEFFLHHDLGFTEELQRSVPWENLPLEHDWFSVNPVQFTVRSGVNHSILSVQDFTDCGYSAILPPKHSTESEKTHSLAVDHLTTCSCSSVLLIPRVRSKSIVLTPNISSCWSKTNYSGMENKSRISENSVFLVTRKFC